MPRRKRPPEVAEIEGIVAQHMGRKLKLYRRKKLWSLYDVTRMTGISASTISDYEKGKYICPDDRLHTFANLYQAPLSEFELRQAPLDQDVRQIADMLSEWPANERAAIIRALLLYIDNVRELRPPGPKGVE